MSKVQPLPVIPVMAARDSAVEPRRRAAVRRRIRRTGRGGRSIAAEGEPWLWLSGGGLVVCVAMIISLLLLVLVQGLTTFWPVAVVSIPTIGDEVRFGEITRSEFYELHHDGLEMLSGPAQDVAATLLHARLRARMNELLDGNRSSRPLKPMIEQAELRAQASLKAIRPDRESPADARDQLRTQLQSRWTNHREELVRRFESDVRAALRTDDTEHGLFTWWEELRGAESAWLTAEDAAERTASLAADPNLAYQIWANHLIMALSGEAALPVERWLVRTGNFELTGEHFQWVSDFEVAAEGRTVPDWALVFERLSWGRFYGLPKRLIVQGASDVTEPAEIWQQFNAHHSEVRQRWHRRRKLEIHEIGEVNRLLENARLALRRVELARGLDSPEWRAANQVFEQQQARGEEAFDRIRTEIEALDRTNEQYQLIVETAQGQEQALPLSEIVRAYPANQLTWWGKLRVYLSRWKEFLTADPREANSEGGVFPAIWGTVVMTMLMSVVVVPFGVLAALYLREYAKPGLAVSTVRIAVNNLAGVPSIVFGVFGLGFFCYIIGASIDELLFEAKLPNPTFGTGGLFWASLTLALLTLPLVIVATEEALAAVPRSMREGSLACGATKWQTIRRIVLPRAMPGIMTGMILAMARGAGEVAPLMLVGAVKLAPELPVDQVFPYVHLERSFMHLGFHIYDLGFQSQNSEAAKPMVFTTTLLLITLIALMNVAAISLRARLRRKFAHSQF